jgi:hypothetical protein
LFFVGDATDGPVSLSYVTSDGSARAGLDYVARVGGTSFGGPYSRQQDFSIPLLNDSLTEGAETFTITLSTAFPGVTLVPTNIVVTLLEGDPVLRLEPHPAGPIVNGHSRLLLHAPASVAFSLETSTDLRDWTVLTNFPPRISEEALVFDDATTANFERRFYRLLTPPPPH